MKIKDYKKFNNDAQKGEGMMPPISENDVAGALFSFIAHLVMMENPIMIGGGYSVVPMTNELEKWATEKKLPLDSPNLSWEDKLH